jgi:hypothetical protein
MALSDYAPSAKDAQGRARRFPTASEETFSAHDPEYATAQFIYKPMCDEILALIAGMGGNLAACGRLTLESGVSVSTTDQTAKTNIYLTPHSGNVIFLYDSTNWVAFPFAEITKALGTLTSGKNYDVFAYASSGSITGATNATPIVITSNAHGLANGGLVVITGVGGNTYANGLRKVANVATNTFELQDLNGSNVAGNAAYTSGGTWYVVKLEFSAAWTDNTTRADAITRQDGIYVKSSDKTRRYVGTFRTTSTTTTEDSNAKRFVWNMHNKVTRKLKIIDATNTWNHTNTWRQANGNAANQVEIVCGLAGDSLLQIIATGHSRNTTGGTSAGMYTGIGIGSTTVSSADVYGLGQSAVASIIIQTVAALYTPAPLGYQYYAWLEESTVTGTTTWLGDNGGTSMQSGMVGSYQS